MQTREEVEVLAAEIRTTASSIAETPTSAVETEAIATTMSLLAAGNVQIEIAVNDGDRFPMPVSCRAMLLTALCALAFVKGSGEADLVATLKRIYDVAEP